MSTVRMPSEIRNPFTARQIRPGTIDFIYPAEVTTDQLVDQLRANRWRGAIIGPHGSGKSTLLHTLRPALEAATGRPIVWFELHDGQSRLPTSLRRSSSAPGGIVVVDGYEQLSWWSKLWLLWRCQRLSCGLVVTAHRPVALPTLWNTHTDEELALAVVRSLAPAEQLASLELDGAIRRAFSSHQGNIREVLFELYDLYRQRTAVRDR